MTERQKRTKERLNRVYYMSRQLEADERMLEVLGQRLAPGAAKYESDGTESHDPDAARARHEDNLLDYSIQVAKVEKLRGAVIAATVETREAIERLSDCEEKSIAIDRYINRLRWEDISKVEHISIAKVYRLNSSALNKLADILKI